MKKAIYLFLTIILVSLFSLLVHLPFVVLFTPDAGMSCMAEGTPILSVLCLFPLWALYSVGIIGIIGGFFLGQLWWHMVYIQKRHWSFENRKKK